MIVDQKTKIFFPNLDGLRFIAFFFVFSEHILWAAVKTLNVQSPFWEHVLYTLFANGGLGVSVFFVLSGFLITFLILKEIEVRGKLDIKAFYIRRFLRIWPLYYLVLIFAFYLYPFLISFIHPNPDVFGDRQIYYFTFLSNFDLIHITTEGLKGSFLTGVTWSVAVEEQFYLIWPLLFYFVPKKYFISIFISVILISLSFRCLHLNEPFVLYFHSLGVSSDLAIGGLAAYLSLNSSVFINYFKNTSVRKRIVIYISGILYVLLSGYFFNVIVSTLIDRLVTSIFVAWIIMDQNFCNSERLKLSQFKWISKWGIYTYGMYLLHQIALLLVLNTYQYLDIEAVSFWQKLLKAAIVLFLTFLMSYISYNWFEKYFLNLKKHFAYFTKN
ncbi:MAG: acyltransferase [Bacteroidetes bacterium]|nr:acyltransferase [Bacteroidota bacterium]